MDIQDGEKMNELNVKKLLVNLDLLMKKIRIKFANVDYRCPDCDVYLCGWNEKITDEELLIALSKHKCY